MNKWYSTAAVAGSAFEHLGERIIPFEDLDQDILKTIDLLFLDDVRDFYSKFRLYHSIALSDKEIPVESQEKFILLHPGANFFSRIGHDIINLFTPFEQFEYLEDKVIKDRVTAGLKFGRQINIAGHLLQGSGFNSSGKMNGEDLLCHLRILARKKGVDIFIENEDIFNETILCSESILNIVLEEIVDNCKQYSAGRVDLTIEAEKKIVFKNELKENLDPCRAKSRLRWPFVKSMRSRGNGMGLFIVSAASVNGGFDWDIKIEKNAFYLSLSF